MSRLRHIFSRMPLRRKLMLVVVSTGLAGIGFASAALFAHQVWNLRAQFRVEMEALARIVAHYVVAPVSFGDQRGVEDSLSILNARPEIIRVELRQADGTMLARFEHDRFRGADGPLDAPGYRGWHLTVVQPLILQEEALGELRIEATFQPVVLEAVETFLPAMLGMIAISGLGLAVLTRFLVTVLLAGLHQLTSSAGQIATTGDYTVRATAESQDEIGTLTRTFNHMLDQLQATDQTLRSVNASLNSEITERKRLERALVESSRVAGMAEVATGVLHNVGNVLNSINVSTQLLRERVEGSQLSGLQQLADLLRPHQSAPAGFLANDPRAPLALQFVVALADQYAGERRATLEELQLLARNVEHVKEVVAAQQNFARTTGVIEVVDLAEVLDDAVRIHESSLVNHRVTVTRDFVPGVTLGTDRHKLLQILVNLVSNAIHAVKTRPFDQRRVELTIRSDAGRYQVLVTDSGVGIAAENLTRIFQHGFTTRRDGHGFGLHSGALAARTLGGSLRVASEGPDCGACFTLELADQLAAAGDPAGRSAVPFPA